MIKIKQYFLCSIILIIFLSAVIVLCRTTYQVSRYNVCPPQDSTLHTLVDRSIEQCVEECTRRKSCAVVGYKSSVRLCELHATSLSPDIADNRCTLITREDMIGPECNCPECSACDAGSGPCMIKECRLLPPLDNGTVHGNKNHIRAKKMAECATGFFEINNVNRRSIECSKSGNWSYIPHCQECPTAGELIKFPWSRHHQGFKFFTGKKTHQEANDSCFEQNSHLLRLNTWWKKRYIRGIQITCFDQLVDGNGYHTPRYWTDGKRDDKGNWRYSNGKNVPMHHLYWYKIRADKNRNCVQLIYKLLDMRCDLKLRYICELN